jgi:hypothetical protein
MKKNSLRFVLTGLFTLSIVTTGTVFAMVAAPRAQPLYASCPPATAITVARGQLVRANITTIQVNMLAE